MTTTKKAVTPIKVTLIKSVIGRIESHKATVRGLGLRRMHHSVQLEVRLICKAEDAILVTSDRCNQSLTTLENNFLISVVVFLRSFPRRIQYLV